MDISNAKLEWRGLSLYRGDNCLQTDLQGTVAAGEAMTLRGPNGCGKTTLLRTLCGLTLPETGEIRWQGTEIHKCRGLYYAQLAYSGHNNGLKGDLSTRENLRFSARLRGHQPAATDLLDALGLSQCADLPIRNLSAGQRRRASLSLVLGSGARCWVLDEPYTNLDKAGSDWVGEQLNAHLAGGGLLLLAAHQDSRIESARETTLELAAAGAL